MGLSTANTSIISSDRGKPSAPVTCDRFLLIKCLTERVNKDFRAKMPRPQRMKSEFRISKLETISNSKVLKQRMEIPGCLWHLYFCHLDLFRISDFGFLGLFVFVALCAFAARPVEYSHGRGICVELVTEIHGASPVEYRLDQDRAVRLKRYSTGQVILYPIFSSIFG